MAKICIVGTEGAGKTIFLSVFAMRYQDASSGHPWMEFKNRETARYVAEVWGTLANQEWPPSTGLGVFPKLEWGLHTAGETGHEEHNITVLDAPGQAIRANLPANISCALFVLPRREDERERGAASLSLPCGRERQVRRLGGRSSKSARRSPARWPMPTATER